MASSLSDTRFGRAVMAGVPVALVILGAEIADGDWMVERAGRGYALSWSSTPGQHAFGAPGLKLSACVGAGCGRWSLAVSLPKDHAVVGLASVASSVIDAVMSDCPGQTAPLRVSASA